MAERVTVTREQALGHLEAAVGRIDLDDGHYTPKSPHMETALDAVLGVVPTVQDFIDVEGALDATYRTLRERERDIRAVCQRYVNYLRGVADALGAMIADRDGDAL